MKPASGSALLHANRKKPGTWSLLTALFGAPVAWTIQLTVSEPLAAFACYPYQAPLNAPLWQGLPWLLFAISLGCLILAIVSGVVAWQVWRLCRQPAFEQPAGKNGKPSKYRFLAGLGVISSFIFITAVVFNGFAVWLVPLCHSGD